MGFDAEQVTTLSFDSYSTIVDVEAATAALSDYTDDAESVSNLWRTRSLSYAMHSTLVDTYQPFYEMLRDALDYALAANNIDISEDECDEVLSVYHELDVFEDVRGGLERIVDGGYDCYVLSNGNPEMLDSLVEHADIEDLVEDTISADEVQKYKPAPEPYRHAAARMGTPIGDIAHVAAGWWDIRGALHAGMKGIRADRKGLPWGPYDGEPDLTIETFDELADELGV